MIPQTPQPAERERTTRSTHLPVDADAVELELSVRERLLRAMIRSLATHGYHGSALSDVLALANSSSINSKATAGAAKPIPKGVMYHHFPGGKLELAIVAVRETSARSADRLAQAMNSGLPIISLLEGWIKHAGQGLADSGFATGCPFASVALNLRPEDQELRAALREAFDQMRAAIAEALVKTEKMDADEAANWAELLIAAYEGGLIQARIEKSHQPIERAFGAIRKTLQIRLEN